MLEPGLTRDARRGLPELLIRLIQSSATCDAKPAYKEYRSTNVS